MKKILVVFLFFWSARIVSSQMTLDRAIGEAAAELTVRLYPGAAVAMVNFNSGSEKMADFVMEEVHRLLVQAEVLTVVERRQIDLVREELNFQMSGEVSDETFQGIGHMIGVEYVITGSIERIGKVYRFRIWAIDVDTAQVTASYSANVQNDRITASLMGVSADLLGLDDYTPLERSGSFMFNLIPLVSVGSWMMGDYKGALITSGIQMIGFTLCIVSSVLGFENPNGREAYTRSDNTFDQERYDDESVPTPLGTVGLWAGLALTAGGYIFNLVRPYHVHKAPPQTAAPSLNNLGLAYVPEFPGAGTGGLHISYILYF
jgi:TolB-like protein